MSSATSAQRLRLVTALSQYTDRAIGHRSTTRPAFRSALSSPVQLGHGRSAQLHQHTPALTGWTRRFCVEGHAPARASHELKNRTLQWHGPNRRSCHCHMRRWLALRGQRASCPRIRPSGCLNVLSRSHPGYSRNKPPDLMQSSAEKGNATLRSTKSSLSALISCSLISIDR